MWRLGEWVVVLLVFFLITFPVSGFSSDGDTDLWESLRTRGSFVLLRHAVAPGVGDPDHFILDDCSTQRNLSDAGRKQAIVIGDLFRTNGVQKARVFSSRWCRCLETAELLDLGPVEKLQELNSFFRQYERRDIQTQNLKQWLSKQKNDQPLVLVTHQVNITALTEFYPASGEIVMARISESGKILYLGSVKTTVGEKVP